MDYSETEKDVDWGDDDVDSDMYLLRIGVEEDKPKLPTVTIPNPHTPVYDGWSEIHDNTHGYRYNVTYTNDTLRDYSPRNAHTAQRDMAEIRNNVNHIIMSHRRQDAGIVIQNIHVFLEHARRSGVIDRFSIHDGPGQILDEITVMISIGMYAYNFTSRFLY